MEIGCVNDLSGFQVNFSDGECMTVKDIINFSDVQKEEIRAIANNFTKYNLRNIKKYGVDLFFLTDEQKKIIIFKKNMAISLKSSDQFLKFSEHSLDQILKRRGSIQSNVIFDIIQRFKVTNYVDKAQFKGYSYLSYSLSEIGDPDKYGFVISFYYNKKGNQRIKLITLFLSVNSKDFTEEQEATEYRITEVNSDYYETLMQMKRRLEKRNSSK